MSVFQGWACTPCHTVQVILSVFATSTWVSRTAHTHDAQLSGLGVDRKFTPTGQPRSPTSTSTNESTGQRNRNSVRINVVPYNKYLQKHITTWSSNQFSLRLWVDSMFRSFAWFNSQLRKHNESFVTSTRTLTHLRFA